jgi:hypothetical protein
MEHIMDCRMLLSGRANMTISRSEEILELIVQYENEDVFHNIIILDAAPFWYSRICIMVKIPQICWSTSDMTLFPIYSNKT